MIRQLILLLSLIFATPAVAQVPQWNPAAPYVTPQIGPVEVVSVYRNPRLNACAGGAPESTHKLLGAVDMVPLKPITREALMTRLCQIHQASGERFLVGLGLYKGIRFHIDARKFREWGMSGARGGFGCTAVLAEGPMPFTIAPPDFAGVPVTATDPLSPRP